MDKVKFIKENIITGNFNKIFSLFWSTQDINKFEAKEVFLFLYDYTNSFKNSNTTPEILSLSWEMLKHGIDHDKLIVERTKKTLPQMKLCNEIIKNIKLYNEWEISWTIINKELLNNFWFETFAWKSFMSNILITISWTRLGFIIIERGDWKYEVVLWSKFEENNIEELNWKLNLDNNWFTNIESEKILKIILQS